MGWRVTVADDREQFLDSQRFSGARAFVLARPHEVAAAAAVDHRTYALIMSHNFFRDRDYLRSFFGTSVGYIGMLGPYARLERLLEDLRGDGVSPSKEDAAKIHGPAGLDLGADGPEEIALAIMSEVLAVHRHRTGGFLKGRTAPMHDRPQPAEAP